MVFLVVNRTALYTILTSLFFCSFPIFAEQDGALAGYTPEAVDLIEFLYGDGMLEIGGTESIDHMFAGIDLTNKYVLDIGSGIGGVDTYLAQKYTVKILGVDPELMLVERATKRAASLKESLKGAVTFEQLSSENNLKQYTDNTFDIVMSRGAILHVPHADKGPYFAEMLRVLKPDGLLIIDDWMRPSSDYTDAVKEMVAADGIPYSLVTPEEYITLLTTAGFTKISLQDTTDHAFSASANALKRAEQQQVEMIERFGEEMYDFSLKSWSLQKDIFQQRELLTGIVTAEKK